MTNFSDYLSERSTLNTILEARRVNLDTHKGNEKFEFEIGDKVVTTGKGVIIAGIELEITALEDNNGYARYRTGKMFHRQGELVKFYG